MIFHNSFTVDVIYRGFGNIATGNIASPLEILQPVLAGDMKILRFRGKYCVSMGNIATNFWLLIVAIFPNPLYVANEVVGSIHANNNLRWNLQSVKP